MKMSVILFSALLSIISSVNVLAHNVVGGVYASGFEIEGEAGFSNGHMASKGTAVKVFDISGIPLGEVLTDSEGYFTFTAQKRITHVFEVDMGAGHKLTMQLPAEELPDNNEAKVHQEYQNATTNDSVKNTHGFSEPEVTNKTQLNSLLLEKAIAKQIKPLRKEIQALKEKSGFRDIIGGIGYIFGLLGLIAFLRERKMKANS